MTAAFKVGQPATVTVLYSGEVKAIGDTCVTIGDHVVPSQLGPGVRTVSLCRLSAVCDRDHCDDGDCDPDSTVQGPCSHGEEDALDDLGRAVTTRHLDHHDGALRFCPDPVCRALDELHGSIQ